MRMIHRLFALFALLVVGLAVVRNSAVHAVAPNDPDQALWWWPSHPLAQSSTAMGSVGKAALAGRPASPDTIATLDEVAVKEPLAVEPLLVHAVAAQTAGDLARAERLYRLANARRGRSLPPHYFLADLYLRSGRIADGLREVANLARLAPNGIGSSTPYIAQYARNPANWPRMRAIFRDHPELVDPVLTALAPDPANAAVILALADESHRGADALWLRPLLGAMIGGGQFQQARSLWARISGVRLRPGDLLHDPDFSDDRSPPPFNWDLAQSSTGLAERRRGSGLHVIFYGSQNGPLVRQLLILAPGNYRLALRASGQLSDPQALSWTVRCDKSAIPLAAFPMPRPGAFAWSFTVPADCSAQWLELAGRAQDIGGRSDLVIPTIALRGGGPNG